MKMTTLPRSQDGLPAATLEPLAQTDTTPATVDHFLSVALAGTALAALLITVDIVIEGYNRWAEILAAFLLVGLGIAMLLHIRRLRAKAVAQGRLSKEIAGLVRAKQTAENANLAKSRYLASVSHEIRSPLNAIYGYAQLFERGDGINAQEASRVILRCTEHLTFLVEGLLDISQLEFGMLRVRTEEVRLSAFLDQIVSMMRPSAYTKGLAFIYETPERMPEFVRLDQGRLRQVLINLLSNAIKFTRSGSVTLKMTCSGQIATFEVRDTGPGIPAEDHERIFERFERAGAANDPGEAEAKIEPGAGLGLAIARTIVEILGGKLELESEVGVGTCFRITMMLSEVSGRIASLAPARKRIGYQGRQRSLLLVEDDGDQRLFMEHLLRTFGFAVHAYPSGEEALAALDDKSLEDRVLDLAILDISLPGMSGWETGVSLREQFGDPLQILMLSANSDELHRPEHDSPAHDRFLVKPVEFETLADTLGELLHLSWRWDDEEPTSTAAPEPPSDAGPAIGDSAQPHILRLREFLRIGYVRGIEAEIKELEKAAPQTEPLVRRLYDCLDRYDLAGMARLLQEN